MRLLKEAKDEGKVVLDIGDVRIRRSGNNIEYNFDDLMDGYLGDNSMVMIIRDLEAQGHMWVKLSDLQFELQTMRKQFANELKDLESLVREIQAAEEKLK